MTATPKYRPRFETIRALRVAILKPGEVTDEQRRGFMLQDADGAVVMHIVDEETFNLFFELVEELPEMDKDKTAKLTICKLIEALLLRSGPLQSAQIIEGVKRFKPKTDDQVVHTELQRMKRDGLVDNAKIENRRAWILLSSS